MAREHKDTRPGSGRGAGSGEGNAPSHRWAIDRIEEGTAAVEQDGDHLYEIPRYLIPPDARDGDVLTATVTSVSAGEVSITVRIDRGARSVPSAKGSARNRHGGSDPGGDIVL